MKLPRNNKHKYRVIYHHEMMESVVGNAAHDFPNETGGFLLGQPQFLGTGVWVVTGFYSATDPKATPSQFGFGPGDYMRAVTYAARKNLVVVGMYHSHPWRRNPPLVITAHSEDDAHVQAIYDFPLSLVVGLTPEGWTIETWKNGYNSPIWSKIGKGKKEYSLHEFINKNLASPLWGSHLAAAKTKQDK
jgi:proteasome lid subunit RPN8/RPN11